LFKKFKNKADQISNKNEELSNYFSKLKDPGYDRKNDLYYVEMQQLAFNLARYLKMETKDNVFQGNWNFTYLTENLSKEDYMLIARKFLGNLTAPQWKEIIQSSSFKDDKELIELVDDVIKSNSIYEIKYKPKLQAENITYVVKPDLHRALVELENKFELESIEYKLYK
jgi:hypothetical protein